MKKNWTEKVGRSASLGINMWHKEYIKVSRINKLNLGIKSQGDNNQSLQLFVSVYHSVWEIERYSVFHQFRQAKFANGGSIVSSR